MGRMDRVILGVTTQNLSLHSAASPVKFLQQNQLNFLPFYKRPCLADRVNNIVVVPQIVGL
jgi:hypothetical protein